MGLYNYMMHKIHKSRGPVLGLFLACFVLAACSCDTDPEGSRPRNVILISLDTVRQDRLTYAGHREKTSPTIDRLAREGTSFSNASASAAADGSQGPGPMAHGSEVWIRYSALRVLEERSDGPHPASQPPGK